MNEKRVISFSLWILMAQKLGRGVLLITLLPILVGFGSCGEDSEPDSGSDLGYLGYDVPLDLDLGLRDAGSLDVGPDAGCCVYCGGLWPCAGVCIDFPECPEGPGCACP